MVRWRMRKLTVIVVACCCVWFLLENDGVGLRESLARYSRLFASGLTKSAGTQHPKYSQDFVTRPSKAGRSCSVPATNIAFIKTHKTAGSAVQNVLLRYGENHHLRFALSVSSGDIRFYYPEVFRAEYVRHQTDPHEGDKPLVNNIICHHMRFKYEEVRRVVPDNARFVTILREPAALFESTFKYFRHVVTPFRVSPDEDLERWLNNTPEFFERGRTRGTGGMWYLAKSGTFFDLGFNNLVDHTGYVDLAISQLEKQFDLVMITEYFDESMILLKDLMCWSMSDIVSLKHNVRTRRTNITQTLAKKVREWNKADAALYDHFNKTLWEKIEKYGREKMEKQVKQLRALNRSWKEYCVQDVVSSGYYQGGHIGVPHPRNVHINTYVIRPERRTNKTCIQLTMGEDAFSNLISLQQDGRKF